MRARIRELVDRARFLVIGITGGYISMVAFFPVIPADWKRYEKIVMPTEEKG